MSAVLSAAFGAGWQFFSNTGVILSGGFLYTYAAGSTSPVATYTDSSQATQNANPIPLDSTGRPPNEIWIANSTSVKFVLTDSNNSVIRNYDFVPGINSSSAIVSEWVQGLAATYVNSTSFTVLGNNVPTYQVNRRVQYNVTSGTYYGTILTSTFNSGPGTTTVVITPDNTGLDSSLSNVNYGFMAAINSSIPTVFVPILNPTFQGIVTIPAGAVIAGYAQTAGATFTGNVYGPQPPAADSSALLATTAFVTAAGLTSALPGQGGQSGQWIQTVNGAAGWANAFRKYETERVIRRGRQYQFS
jgi:hypothetical protein